MVGGPPVEEEAVVVKLTALARMVPAILGVRVKVMLAKTW